VEATVKLDHGMTFWAQADTGFRVKMDASSSVGGDDNGPRPMELMLMSLGGCTGMDVISILRKKRQNVTGFELKLAAEQADDHPHVFTHITVTYIVHGEGIDPKAVSRAIELSTDRYCPAHAMLSQATTIEHTYEIVEEKQEASADF